MYSLKKDAYYFSHDSNAKDDFKIMLLIEELGLEGYGIFWVLIETLREQESFKYPIKLLPSLSRKYNTTLTKMEVVVKNYNLFIIDSDSFFFSESLNNRMELMNKKREQARRAGIKSGEARKNKKIERTLNGSSTNVEQLNKSKRNEKKEIKDVSILKSLSVLSAKEISSINIDSLELSDECKKILKSETLATVINYSVNNTEYLIEKIISIKNAK